MKSVKLCECGCGDPAVYAARHVKRTARMFFTAADYTVEDRGYKTRCWISIAKGAANGGGYPSIRSGGRQGSAHRLMYEQAYGPIPDGLWIDHLCRVPRCVRPAHLEAVTPAENARRAIDAKLTLAQVRKIRRAEGTIAARALARSYGVSNSLIYQIWRGKVWPDP